MSNEENHEENQEQNGEEKQYKDFISTALRKPRKGIRQQLMAQLLIKANITSDALLKVQSICEVSYMSEKHKDKIDMNLVEAASLVSTSLINTEKADISSKRNPSMIRCSWAFKQTEENYKKYIEPWHVIDLRHYSLYTKYVSDKYPDFPRDPVFYSSGEQEQWCEYRDKILEGVSNWFKKSSEAKGFYEQTYALSKLSFLDLKGEFENWAIAKLRPIQALVAEEIDQEIYKDVIQLLMKQGKKEEEEAEHEGRLDT